jgi:hypothetical protein
MFRSDARGSHKRDPEKTEDRRDGTVEMHEREPDQ